MPCQGGPTPELLALSCDHSAGVPPRPILLVNRPHLLSEADLDLSGGRLWGYWVGGPTPNLLLH